MQGVQSLSERPLSVPLDNKVGMVVVVVKSGTRFTRPRAPGRSGKMKCSPPDLPQPPTGVRGELGVEEEQQYPSTETLPSIPSANGLVGGNTGRSPAVPTALVTDDGVDEGWFGPLLGTSGKRKCT